MTFIILNDIKLSKVHWGYAVPQQNVEMASFMIYRLLCLTCKKCVARQSYDKRGISHSITKAFTINHILYRVNKKMIHS